jgi:2-dehydro-3-deoxyphosphooctonate aldolase (KDO 8-P synthase)
VACARSGRPVNIKKGQFMAPQDMANAAAKCTASGAEGVMVTERGASFGYNNLVVDMRALPVIRGLGLPVCLDATHSIQRPAAEGDRSGGDRQFVPFLARAGAAAGIDALFIEVHEDPDHALSDGPNMVPLHEVEPLLEQVLAIDRLVRS